MVALITGGSSGMGLEFARGLGARGYDLILVSNREDDLQVAASGLGSELPVKVRTRFQDLAQPRAADDLHEWCVGEGIIPDVLVNDAGMFFFKELNVEDMDRVQAMLDLHVTTVTSERRPLAVPEQCKGRRPCQFLRREGCRTDRRLGIRPCPYPDR